ncbi:MAG: hypothetical protein U0892_16750 [Pirellulales bacterium]
MSTRTQFTEPVLNRIHEDARIDCKSDLIADQAAPCEFYRIVPGRTAIQPRLRVLIYGSQLLAR